jgi:adenine-specific DNA-methyltransferase
MTDSQTKLKGLLRELFQLDNADLDFGIYRIMNAKRVEIERFLDSDLLPQVKQAFEQYQSSDSVGIKAELDKTIQQAKEMGVADAEMLPKVKELRGRLAVAVDAPLGEPRPVLRQI